MFPRHPVEGAPEVDIDALGSRDEEASREQPAGLVHSAEIGMESGTAADEGDDLELTGAYEKLPSSLAVTCVIDPIAHTDADWVVRGARYRPFSVRINGQSLTWYARAPFEVRGRVSLDILRGSHRKTMTLSGESFGDGEAQIDVSVYTRESTLSSQNGETLATFILENCHSGVGQESILFQTELEICTLGQFAFRPFAERPLIDSTDEEMAELALLFRNTRTFARGHGCAANWGEPVGDCVDRIWAETLPTYEGPSPTPDITVVDEAGCPSALSVEMKLLANGSSVGDSKLERVLESYEAWIEEQKQVVPTLQTQYVKAAKTNLQRCEVALSRMRAGLKVVQGDERARLAFKLANEAILMQQYRSRLPKREFTLKGMRTNFSTPMPIDPQIEDSRASWRAFQIGFFLSVIPELVDPTDSQRENVDLIFFPTGGGKTEAYLGAAAFAIIHRRLENPEDSGTTVMMRYTLRLLSAQQFSRASSLIAVLEHMRRRPGLNLGTEPISIGIWVGGGATPNRWKDAIRDHGDMSKSPDATNRFLLRKCPWCGARFGYSRLARGKGMLHGYERVGQRIEFVCPDVGCPFGGRSSLPIHVVDDGIYAARPSFLLGTVDKFAMLAWRTEARRLFGLGIDGERELSPPNLIIQDELHLISGPLGSMVGIYEPVIEELCTDRRHIPPVRPKIIAATATIRNFKTQIRDLYGREEATLFPPNGLEQGHSFFAEPAVNEDGTFKPGRRYLGIHAPALRSMQSTQVRVLSAALVGGMRLEPEQRDPYWTNLCFFNSLRELGNTVSLLQSDIPDYLKGWAAREGVDRISMRMPKNVRELTSRRSEEITKALEELEVSLETSKTQTVDISLASSIVEVGVDIDRLSLMTIVGQPKSTAQYIQVSGRVGRKWKEAPGLVLTLYGVSKPRDRSHFERFREYHERLFAGVEPTSLTPFAEPVVRRGLQGAAASFVRQTTAYGTPFPFPNEAFDRGVELVRSRARQVDPNGEELVSKYRDSLVRKANAWNRTEWDGNQQGGSVTDGLMRYAGSVGTEESLPMWEVASSMRNVDAECQLRVSTYYAELDGEGTNE
ncbi:helicase-related protein [Arthrobacter rhombi]|uniref:helicase-related protein n=1 Tax=Arthrobacter rhombi TaxID=71253 RepID=UPI0031E23808